MKTDKADTDMEFTERGYRQDGFTLIELMLVLVIFSIVMAGLYSGYSAMMKQGVKEFRTAQSEMEMGISSNIIKRDMSMAGYGLADDYAGTGFTPRSAGATDGITQNATTKGYPDTLTLMGTAIGMDSRAAQGWSYITAVAGGVPTIQNWGDAREDITTATGSGDIVIIMDPATKRLLVKSGDWRYKFNGAAAMTGYPSGNSVALDAGNVGHLMYGLCRSGETASQPFYAVSYYLGGTPPKNCAPNTLNLLRAESRTTSNPVGVNPTPVMNCVAEFQVALGLTLAGTPDTAVQFPIDTWDNGGVTAAGYAPADLNKRLKQIRIYALVQEGSGDANYVFKNPDSTPGYFGTQKIRVGDLYLSGGAVGKDYTLTGKQINYNWRVVSYVVTPRNVR